MASYGKFLRWDAAFDAIRVMTDAQVREALYAFRVFHAQQLMGDDGFTLASSLLDTWGRIQLSSATNAINSTQYAEGLAGTHPFIRNTRYGRNYNSSTNLPYPSPPNYLANHYGASIQLWQRNMVDAYSRFPMSGGTFMDTYSGTRKKVEAYGPWMMDSTNNDLYRGTAESLVGGYPASSEFDDMMKELKNEMISGDQVGTYAVSVNSPGTDWYEVLPDFFTDNVYAHFETAVGVNTYSLWLKYKDSNHSYNDTNRPLMTGLKNPNSSNHISEMGEEQRMYQFQGDYRSISVPGGPSGSINSSVLEFLQYIKLYFINYCYKNSSGNLTSGIFPTMGYRVYRNHSIPTGFTARSDFFDTRIGSSAGVVSNEPYGANDYRTYRTPSGSSTNWKHYTLCIADTLNE